MSNVVVKANSMTSIQDERRYWPVTGNESLGEENSIRLAVWKGPENPELQSYLPNNYAEKPPELVPCGPLLSAITHTLWRLETHLAR